MQLLLMCVSRLSMASSNTFLRQKATAEWLSTYSANVPWPKVVWGQKTRQQQKTGIAPNLVLITIITIIITTTTITIIIIIMLFIMMLIIICITVSL
jgi:ABC-type transport system involved in cytochrome bd biosynthesis fused ATPase/permease subunit